MQSAIPEHYMTDSFVLVQHNWKDLLSWKTEKIHGAL